MHFKNFPIKIKIYVVFLKKVLSKKVIRRLASGLEIRLLILKKCHDFGLNITDFGRTKAKSLILCIPNSNPNPK